MGLECLAQARPTDVTRRSQRERKPKIHEIVEEPPPQPQRRQGKRVRVQTPGPPVALEDNNGSMMRSLQRQLREQQKQMIKLQEGIHANNQILLATRGAAMPSAPAAPAAPKKRRVAPRPRKKAGAAPALTMEDAMAANELQLERIRAARVAIGSPASAIASDVDTVVSTFGGFAEEDDAGSSDDIAAALAAEGLEEEGADELLRQFEMGDDDDDWL